MVRNLLTVGFMADGYPIDGKPKEKTEKMHPGILKRWIAFFAIVAVVAVVAYFAFAAQTPVKNAIGPPVKTAEVLPAENPAVNTVAEQGTIIQTSELLSRWGPLMSVDNIPAEIKLPSSENLYVTNLVISGNKISGYVKNTGVNKEQAVDNIILVSAEGYGGASLVLRFTDGINEIAPSKSKYFEILETRENQLSQQHAKFFRFRHG